MEPGRDRDAKRPASESGRYRDTAKHKHRASARFGPKGLGRAEARPLQQPAKLFVGGGGYLVIGGFGFAAQGGHGVVVGWEEVAYYYAHGAGG